MSVLNRKYGDKEFCALITNEIIIAVLCRNNKKPSPMKIIFVSLYIVLAGREKERTLFPILC